VVHHPFSYVITGFPARHGGQLRFLRNRYDQVTLPRPVVEAIETAHQASVEFFPVRITGQGSLDYTLLPAHGRDRVSELEAINMRQLMLSNIEQILLAHQKLLKLTEVKFRTAHR
jgi:hypothetical protein